MGGGRDNGIEHRETMLKLSSQAVTKCEWGSARERPLKRAMGCHVNANAERSTLDHLPHITVYLRILCIFFPIGPMPIHTFLDLHIYTPKVMAWSQSNRRPRSILMLFAKKMTTGANEIY